MDVSQSELLPSDQRTKWLIIYGTVLMVARLAVVGTPLIMRCHVTTACPACPLLLLSSRVSQPQEMVTVKEEYDGTPHDSLSTDVNEFEKPFAMQAGLETRLFPLPSPRRAAHNIIPSDLSAILQVLSLRTNRQPEAGRGRAIYA